MPDPNLGGTWTVYRVAAKGTTRVIDDGSSLTISSANSTVIYTPDGGIATSALSLLVHTSTSFQYSSVSNGIVIDARVCPDVSGNKLLVGFARRTDAAGQVLGVDSFAAIDQKANQTPSLDDNRFELNIHNHSGTRLIEDRGELLLSTVTTSGGQTKRVVVLALRGCRPILLPTNTTSGATLSETWSQDTNLSISLRAIDFKTGTSPNDYFVLVGHVTWVGGMTAVDGGIAGTDDADSFTAVRVGPGTFGGDEGGA